MMAAAMGYTLSFTPPPGASGYPASGSGGVLRVSPRLQAMQADLELSEADGDAAAAHSHPMGPAAAAAQRRHTTPFTSPDAFHAPPRRGSVPGGANASGRGGRASAPVTRAGQLRAQLQANPHDPRTVRELTRLVRAQQVRGDPRFGLAPGELNFDVLLNGPGATATPTAGGGGGASGTSGVARPTSRRLSAPGSTHPTPQQQQQQQQLQRASAMLAAAGAAAEGGGGGGGSSGSAPAGPLLRMQPVGTADGQMVFAAVPYTGPIDQAFPFPQGPSGAAAAAAAAAAVRRPVVGGGPVAAHANMLRAIRDAEGDSVLGDGSGAEDPADRDIARAGGGGAHLAHPMAHAAAASDGFMRSLGRLRRTVSASPTGRAAARGGDGGLAPAEAVHSALVRRQEAVASQQVVSHLSDELRYLRGIVRSLSKPRGRAHAERWTETLPETVRGL
jgi:hypothetical protein